MNKVQISSVGLVAKVGRGRRKWGSEKIERKKREKERDNEREGENRTEGTFLPSFRKGSGGGRKRRG